MTGASALGGGVLLWLASALPLSGCADAAGRCAGLTGEPMLTAELYFGRSAHGGLVDEPAWQVFLARSVTPRFPSGFTVLDGRGQWQQRATGRIIAEPSTVLIVVAGPGAATIAALEAIRQEYREAFGQESVGLVLTESCGSF